MNCCVFRCYILDSLFLFFLLQNLAILGPCSLSMTRFSIRWPTLSHFSKLPFGQWGHSWKIWPMDGAWWLKRPKFLAFARARHPGHCDELLLSKVHSLYIPIEYPFLTRLLCNLRVPPEVARGPLTCGWLTSYLIVPAEVHGQRHLAEPAART